MFDKKSDYAQNRKKRDAIVYGGVAQRLLLHEQDFERPEDFARWKAWSDADYCQIAANARSFYEHVTLLDRIDYADKQAMSAEDLLIEQEETAWVRNEQKKAIAGIRHILTKKQFRRFWLYYAEGKTFEEIAMIEGVSYQSAAQSVRSAQKKLQKWIKKKAKSWENFF